MEKLLNLFKSKNKETYFLSAMSLFIIPLVYFPFLVFSFTQGKEITFKAIVLFGALFFLINLVNRKNLKINSIGNSALFILLFAQLLIHAFANLSSETPLVTLYGTFFRGEGFIFDLYLFVFLIWNAVFLNKDGIYKSLKYFWAGSLILASYAILQKIGVEIFFSNYSTNLFQGRVFSFLGNPSFLGQFMTLALLVSLYLTGEFKGKKHKFFGYFATLIIFVALILSGTRSAILALAFMSILYAIKYRSLIWNTLRQNLKLLLLIPVLALLVQLAPNDRFDLSNVSLRSLNSRFEIWNSTSALIKEKPFFGYGQETFYIYFPEVVSSEFLELEEDVNISADRVHNEILEEIYSYGIFAGILWFLIFLFIFKKFFKSKEKIEIALAGAILANMVQNQLSFSDTSILVFIAFALGSLIALESKAIKVESLFYKNWRASVGIAIFSILILIIGFFTIFRPLMSHYRYTVYKENYANYEYAVTSLKKSLELSPYFSDTWYELMFVDPSSMKRALTNLQIIEGESGNVLAWMGNYYAESDPSISADYYLMALEKNPNHPNWLRAFGDMLYAQNDCESALYIYNQYLEVVPEYWKWSTDIDSYTNSQQRSYETFFKHAPYFWGTLEKMENCFNGPPKTLP